jgi:hypothetical protein
MLVIRTALALAIVMASPSARSQANDAPEIGDRMADGFVVKCYWTGVFDKTEWFGGQGVVGTFGQLLSPLNGTQKSHVFFFATQEVDNTGQMRIVVRDALWSSTVSHLHYWSKANDRPGAGPGGSGSGTISPGDLQISANEGEKTANGQSTVNLSVSLDATSDAYQFDVRYHPLEMKGLGVKVSSETKTMKWNANVWGLSASDEPVKPHQTTTIRREWDVPGTNFRAYWAVTRECDMAEVHLITPHGDPRTAPVDSGKGQNEYTFNSAKPGTLTIKFEAVATPSSSGILQHIKDDVRFEVDGISGSKMEWATANPGGKSSVEGAKLVAKATFTGLPEAIDHMGRKKVQLHVQEAVVEKTNIEIFFPRDAINHPAGQPESPNWFYYYLQTVPKLGPHPNITYSKTITSKYDPNLNKIFIDDAAIRPYPPPYGKFGTLKGIDTFAWCVTHEMQHYADWANFWGIEKEGKAKWLKAKGGLGPNDDFDADYIPNKVEDANGNGSYDKGDLYDWKSYRTATPGLPNNIKNDFEDWNCKRHGDVRGDHKRDWADPGMQHKTLENPDD